MHKMIRSLQVASVIRNSMSESNSINKKESNHCSSRNTRYRKWSTPPERQELVYFH